MRMWPMIAIGSVLGGAAGLGVVTMLVAHSPAPVHASCATKPNIEIEVAFRQEPLVENATGKEALAEMFGLAHGTGKRVNALTTIRRVYQPLALVTSAKLADGSFCASAAKVMVKIDGDMTIHMANDIKPGTCRWDAVLHHEQKHVAVNQQAISRSVETIRTSLSRELAETLPVTAPTEEAAKNGMINAVRSILDREMARSFQQAKAENILIDNPEEYAAVDAACK